MLKIKYAFVFVERILGPVTTGKAINESKKMTSRKNSTKSKKKIEISDPINFEHRVHTGYDAIQGEFTDLPRQWTGVISPKSRPQPFIDPNGITSVSRKRCNFATLPIFLVFTVTFTCVLQILVIRRVLDFSPPTALF